jgi:hypothetical protein
LLLLIVALVLQSQREFSRRIGGKVGKRNMYPLLKCAEFSGDSHRFRSVVHLLQHRLHLIRYDTRGMHTFVMKKSTAMRRAGTTGFPASQRRTRHICVGLLYRSTPARYTTPH